jgi:hypothetical protein
VSNDFQSRLLYKQKASAVISEEEPVTVSSSIYAIRYMYPGATQHTTSRIRITCTYRDSDQFEAHSGVIERWSDKGWLLMDDYTDSVLAFDSEEEFRTRMLDYTQSFVLGIPLFAIDKNYLPDTFERKKVSSVPKNISNQKNKNSAGNLKSKQKQKDNYDSEPLKNKDDDSDDDDLDWL